MKTVSIILIVLVNIAIIGVFVYMSVSYRISNFTNNRKLEYVHIPKNAGTSMENFGKANGIMWGRFNENYSAYCDKCTYYIWHTPCFVKEDNTDYFTTIRNPYDRIISEFYYTNSGKIKKGLYGDKKDIDVFYDWFDTNLEIYQKKDTVLGCHFMPQSKYVYDENGERRIEHLVFMDKNFNKNLDKLLKQYNIITDIDTFPRSNKRDKTFSKDDLSQEYKDKIYNMYIDDFNNFGYKKL